MPTWIKNAKQDVPDLRDRIYEPALVPLSETLDPDVPTGEVLNQGREGACTGFAAAATINRLQRLRGRPEVRVSARMLYEMAKRFDEWDGVNYEGSSIRGAIRGWKNNGVCRDQSWPYTTQKGRLTIARAEEARSITIGAYYRVRPEIADFHAALNEVGVIACSANVHAGWDNVAASGRIPFRKTIDGGHAFAIVGYDARGFWIQNSWGTDWGKGGTALWAYEDWARNLMDAWVVRLALPTPQIFGVRPRAALIDEQAVEKKPSVPRIEIAGHFVHIDDGKFKSSGRYHSDEDDVRDTAKLVAKSTKYDHLLIYGHGGLNAPKASARRVRAMRDVFKANRIYPYHVMYDTGLAEQLKDLVRRGGSAAKARVGGLVDWSDRRIESLVGGLGTKVWDEMKRDARQAFAKRGAATRTAQIFVDEMSAKGATKKKIHLVGHSTGAVLFAHMLKAFAGQSWTIETCTLLAPACSVDLYDRAYVPVLRGKTKLKLGSLEVLNLNKRLELDDNVAFVYRKSLLFLVSNACERVAKRPLLGMAEFADQVDLADGKATIRYSDGSRGPYTRSTSHGGFDNDPTTMNRALRRILGRPPKRPFTKTDLEY